MSQNRTPQKPGASQRMLRVGELVRHAIVEVFTQEGVHDSVLEGHMLTFPEVRMTPDLRQATVYVMPLGGRDANVVIAALNKNKRWIRGSLAKRIEMRYMPELHFRIDDRFDEAERIDKLLRSPEVARDLKRSRTKDSE
jgi:ribosome-binding factor A